jgi:hypothetical protein
MKKSIHEELVRVAYVMIYKNAIPSVDFDELMDKSPRDHQGVIEIPWRNYEIDEEVFDDIIIKISKEYKLNTVEARQLRSAMILGATPLFSNRHL